VKLKLNAAVDALANSEYAVNSNLRTVIAQVNTISSLSERYAALRERLESCWIELKDIASELESEEADVDLDPERIDVINERLSAIYKLQQKHSVKERGRTARNPAGPRRQGEPRAEPRRSPCRSQSQGGRQPPGNDAPRRRTFRHPPRRDAGH
jgi:hypothetical protein